MPFFIVQGTMCYFWKSNISALMAKNGVYQKIGTILASRWSEMHQKRIIYEFLREKVKFKITSIDMLSTLAKK